MAKYALQDTVPLPPTNTPIPRLGLGVYKAKGSKCAAAVSAALEHGYRHVDTAQGYGNEAEVGESVRQSGLPREQVFVTTKILSPAGSPEKTYAALKGSVEKLGLGYVDCYLIHTPGSGLEGRKELWAALEKLQKEGLSKTIGVSNYGVHHLKEMKEYAKSYPPCLNQIEQRDITSYCEQEGIPIEAYSPLVRQQRADDPDLNSVAEKCGKTTNQILVRYALQKGWIPLPKSESPERIAANADVFGFEIPEVEMQRLDALDQGREGAIAWTPQFGP
ncbi:MAG: hypothetical protein LQ340_005817 [Diploschistes diacapsis]|nr:MAG: hypothetical protein LQ340_005817 [Diploschistes diacapsis]